MLGDFFGTFDNFLCKPVFLGKVEWEKIQLKLAFKMMVGNEEIKMIS